MLGSAEVEKKKSGQKKTKKEEAEVGEVQDDGEVVTTVDRWTDSLINSTSLSQVAIIV